MRVTDRTQVSELSKIRPLGALEHLFWLIDQERSMHLAMAAEISCTISLADWMKALYLVQLRHPMLAVRIEARPRGLPWLCRTHRPIPLRAVEASDGSWEAVVGHELATPFDPSAAPLVRAVLIKGDDRCVLVLVAHHSVADGLSLVYIIRDMLRAFGTVPLDVLPMLPCPDDLLALAGAQIPEGSEMPAGAPSGPGGTFRHKDRAHPTIESRRLGPAHTARIRDRARMEGASLHGALCAAVATAGRRLSSDWRGIPLRFLSPADARPIMDVKDDCGLFVGAATVVLQPDPISFWDAARQATVTARAGKTAAAVQGLLGTAEGVVSSGADHKSACDFAVNAFAREGFISNLGAVPVDLRCGTFKVDALWGPMLLAGFEGDQSIGAVSLDGALHLTHASYTPFPGLLAAVEQTMANACRST